MNRFFNYQHFLIPTLTIFLLTACWQLDDSSDKPVVLPEMSANMDVAIFAGGCFWCTESDFDKVPGVVATISGYIGGTVENPTYKQVVAGETGHVEAVQVYFDTTQTNFPTLLAAYWLTIDPLAHNRQFCDIGSQYRAVVFYRDSEQRSLAEVSKEALDHSGRFAQPVTTEILPATIFYPAESEHQDFYIKNPQRYANYRNNCGRDDRLMTLWGLKH
ncbi:MAG: peptide-methionine (S)-S-oxide reductase MsrA [Betaproteobacteria bacterium]|nr:peptide-methionine (S)-S-oxide reductase MsrA [Betaproteobacteria bacterium]